MSRSSKARVYYWATPALSLLFGLAFLVAFLLGGHPVAGAVALALVLVLIGATIEEVARGRSGAPFTWLAAVFGLTYLATLVVLRLRA